MSVDPFIGEIRWFAFNNIIPAGWQLCDGTLLNIAVYPALHSLIGTTYGGDGFITFAVPDLRGRAQIGFGQGSGLSNRPLGQSAGTETETLTVNQIPSHDHPIPINNSAEANTVFPSGNVPAVSFSSVYNTTSNTNNSTGNTGGGMSHNNMQPFLVLNPCIALAGVFPTP